MFAMQHMPLFCQIICALKATETGYIQCPVPTLLEHMYPWPQANTSSRTTALQRKMSDFEACRYRMLSHSSTSLPGGHQNKSHSLVG